MRIEWVRFDRERYNPRAFAAVRQGAREGTLLDVATDPIFIALSAAQSPRGLDGRRSSLAFLNSGRPASFRIRRSKRRGTVEADGGQRFVFVVLRNALGVGKATLQKREIRVGIADATNYEVLSGLQEGEMVACRRR